MEFSKKLSDSERLSALFRESMSEPVTMTDRRALANFVREADERAFAILVDRYADMIHGTALRKCGSIQLAEEVTQNVFSLLARKAAGLRSANALGVWLHRACLLEASRLGRREANHRRKMKRYAEKVARDADTQRSAADWNATLPHLDDAIDRLGEADRRVIVWRFFEGLSFKEMGSRLGKSDDACQKRTSRALDKLSRSLRRYGIAIPAAAIATGLATQASEAASVTLKSSIAKAALLDAGTASSFTTNLVHIMTYTHWKLTGLAALVALIPLGLQWSQNRSLAERVEAERARVASVSTASTEDEHLGARPSSSAAAATPEDDPAHEALRALREFVSRAEAAPHRRESLGRLVQQIDALPDEALEDAYGILSSSTLTAAQSQIAYNVITAFFHRWGTTAPSEALETAFRQHPYRRNALDAVFSAWSQTDPREALANLSEARSRMRYTNWMSTVEVAFRAFALDEPEEAARAALDFETANEHEETNLVASVAGYWADSNPDKALAWVERLPDGGQREMAFVVALHSISNHDPRRAAELALEMREGSEQTSLLFTVQKKWWSADPAAAEKWFRSHGFRERPPVSGAPLNSIAFPEEKEP